MVMSASRLAGRGDTSPATLADAVAQMRTQFGKGAARKIRRDHKIPAVMYGHGAEPVHITLPGHETMMVLKNANALLTIVIDGQEQLALAKDVQRDAIKPVIEHIDLVIVLKGEKVTVDVPVHLEAAPETVVTLDSQSLQLEVEATHIPEYLTLPEGQVRTGPGLPAYLPPVETWMVIGFGNPGPRYAGNRHNVGAMVVQELASRGSVTLTTYKARAAATTVRIGTVPGGAPGPKAVLGIPTTYMNESGGPVKALMSFFSVEPDPLIVVHDELDIPAGDDRLKLGGGEGGHNGLRSISSSLGTKDYLRVRVGIGRPPGRMDPADYVLRDFSAAERKELPFLLGDTADAVEMVLTHGLTAAQQKFHAPA